MAGVFEITVALYGQKEGEITILAILFNNKYYSLLCFSVQHSNIQQSNPLILLGKSIRNKTSPCDNGANTCLYLQNLHITSLTVNT